MTLYVIRRVSNLFECMLRIVQVGGQLLFVLNSLHPSVSSNSFHELYAKQ